ncbi:major facilitator superfamily domain-containing protein [Abortiporus biennis]|nr:major facilitator superfamily domain-containing protein [Abortiporus biennis]
MASVTPRASGFWSSSARMSYFDSGSDEDVENLAVEEEIDDGRTPLDRTIDRIGMGSYQWTLLSLCGFGWLADNMWIQAVAVILPRVQQQFGISDSRIGLLSSSMFGGMMFGAVGWGTCSDLLGRTAAFNATLFLTSLFGILASFANSFPSLCIVLFFLGSAVGGSMPTDGTLLLEHMPKGKQYLVTALSVFFSFGAVLAAVVGLAVIPSHSCPPSPAPCDLNTQNSGWKYLLVILGIITLSMFLARIVFFRLHESPRYLVHAGRPEEAIVSLQMISKFNGSELSLGLEDVADHIHTPKMPQHEVNRSQDDDRAPFLAGHDEDVDIEQNTSRNGTEHNEPTILFEADVDVTQANPTGGLIDRPRTLLPQNSRDVLRHPPEAEHKDYSATSVTSSPKGPEDGPTTSTASESQWPEISSSQRRRTSSSQRRHRRQPSASSFLESKVGILSKLPRWFRKPLMAWVDRVAMVLSPEWMRTTILVWAVWCSMSLAYTMFNVYLPKLLETRSSLGDEGIPKSLSDSLWDVVIYAIGGCPGAILGAYMVETPLGRRGSLASSTFVTAFFCLVFVFAQHSWAVRASTVGISLSATTMWAVLYGWTPEIFGTKVRGTACGIASALSRMCVRQTEKNTCFPACLSSSTPIVAVIDPSTCTFHLLVPLFFF